MTTGMVSRNDACDVRSIRIPADEPAVKALDTSFTTQSIFEVVQEADGIRFLVQEQPSLLTKSFPLEDLETDQWDRGWVATVDARIVGFIATWQESWRSRLGIYHFYVESSARRKGIGRTLLDRALADGGERGAHMAWLETSNLNHPGIEAYRKMGFKICGADMTHYRGTPSEEEVAIFMARDL
jgi:ribosomal protein S18 acetylase RimI-like enzyme